MINKELQNNLKKLTILYVEDDESISKHITETLLIIFKDVYSTNSAEDALLSYQTYKPDIILSDINLPKKSGIDFAKEIRTNNYRIPIILLTAYTDTDILLDAVKLNILTYLAKPIVFDKLFDSFKMAADDLLIDNSTIKYFTDSIKYDLYTKELIVDDEVVKLTKSEQKLLDIFLNRLDCTISIEYIMKQLWDNPYESTDVAFKSILNKLRKKIGTNSIKNVSGIGYYLNLQKR